MSKTFPNKNDSKYKLKYIVTLAVQPKTIKKPNNFAYTNSSLSRQIRRHLSK